MKAALHPIPASLRSARAFTLAEMLTVLGIILILLVLIVPAVGPLLNSSRINTAGSMLMDELNLARQIALAQNRNVEVRFYRIDPPAGDTGSSEFRAFRSFLTDDDDPALAKPLSKVRYLPQQVVFASQGSLSTLLDTARPTLIQGKETFPQATAATSYVSFLFRSSGGTNLSPVDPPGGNWYVTLHGANDPKNSNTGLPSNYFTVQVDAVTGRVRSYHP